MCERQTNRIESSYDKSKIIEISVMFICDDAVIKFIVRGLSEVLLSICIGDM